MSTEAASAVNPLVQADIPSLWCEVEITVDSSTDIQGLDTSPEISGIEKQHSS